MKRTSSFAMIAAVVYSITGASAQDWNQWRGPGRDASAPELRLPDPLPDAPARQWTVTVGSGYASPVVSGDRLFIFARDGEREVMRCLNLSNGQELWTQQYEAPFTVAQYAAGHGKGPKSTPAVAGGKVFALGIGGVLTAFDELTGRIAWRQTFSDRFPQAAPIYGASTSPIVDGGRVIVHVGGNDGGALVAFDHATGNELWNYGADGPAYASPIVVSLAGRRQLVTQTRANIIGLDASSGLVLWRIPYARFGEQNIITPLLAGDLVIYGGWGKPTVAISLTATPDVMSIVERWRNEDLWTHLSTPVVSHGVLYGFSQKNRGQFVAVDVATGATRWKSAGDQGDGSAIVAAGNALIATTTDGELAVQLMPVTGFSPRLYALGKGPIWAYPVPTSGGVLIRDAASLTLWRF
jgi:outer membrane protein assembly factor BamB